MSDVITHGSVEDFAHVARHARICDAEVERRGETVPCERPAVAISGCGTFGDGLYAVCAYHANRNGACLTLSEIIRMARETA